jgi:hypothetical protein
LLVLNVNSKLAKNLYNTEAKRNIQDAKNKCCIQIIVGICCTEKCPEAFLSCFKLCELEVISVSVTTIPDT